MWTSRRKSGKTVRCQKRVWKNPKYLCHKKTNVTCHANTVYAWLPALFQTPPTKTSLLTPSLGRCHRFRPFHLSDALACLNGGRRSGRRLWGWGFVANTGWADPVPVCACQACITVDFPASSLLCCAQPSLSAGVSAEEFCRYAGPHLCTQTQNTKLPPPQHRYWPQCSEEYSNKILDYTHSHQLQM